MEKYADIKSFGAVGDGLTDDSTAFNRATQNGGYIYIPQGEYMLTNTVHIHSHTHIAASPLAHMYIAPMAQTGALDFLLSTPPDENEISDVSITGGVWDGNCGNNSRGDDMFSKTATTGTMLNFRKIKQLKLDSLVLKNPLCYYMRFCEADDVTVENIRFESDVIRSNQDGVHLGGYCRNFVIRNLIGAKNSPNDDFIALNADDCITRQENNNMLCGEIANILVENIVGELCHRFLRLLSVNSRISDVTVRNVSGSCVNSAVSIDAARGCRTPLFDDKDRPDGVGYLENIQLENFTVNKSTDGKPYIELETNCVSLDIKNFCGANKECAFTRIRNTCPHTLTFGNDKPDINLPDEVTHESDITVKQTDISCFCFNMKTK